MRIVPTSQRLDEKKKIPRVLLVEDEADIRDPLAEYLRSNGFSVATAADAAGARTALAHGIFDLVVLDILMPGEDGLSLCRSLRATSDLPILMLTARNDEIDRILGLEMGADDYIVKPFVPRELMARMRAVLRRTGTQISSALTDSSAIGPRAGRSAFRFDRWVLRLHDRTLVGEDGVGVPIGDAEFRLLLAFVTQPRRVLSREQLLDLADGRERDAFDRSIDNRIVRLRRKLERDAKDPQLIKTVRSGGYLLAAEVRQVQ